MFSARARPPLNASPTVRNVLAAATLGLSPTATPRIRSAFIRAVTSSANGHDRAVTCCVVRATIASNAPVDTRDQLPRNPAGSCESYRSPNRVSCCAMVPGSLVRTCTPASVANCRSRASVCANARRTRSDWATRDRTSHASPASSASNTARIAASHSSANASHAAAH